MLVPIPCRPWYARSRVTSVCFSPPAVPRRLLLRPSGGVPVAPRELRGHVDRVAAARREEDLRARERRDGRESLAQLERRRRGVLLERRVRLDPGHLLEDGLGDLAAPVADVAVPE